MTLLDLCRLIRRYWWIVVALPVVCAGACAAVMLPGSSSGDDGDGEAVSRIVVNSQVGGVLGLASSEARQVADEVPGISAAAKADTATMTISITVSGADARENAQVANELANTVLEQAQEFYRDTQGKESLIAFQGQVEYAKESAASAGGMKASDKMKYLLVAVLAGLFVAVCIVVIIDLVRRPVKSIEGVQEAVELPVLEKLPVADGGERLLANVRFASKNDELANVVVIPTTLEAGAEEAAAALEAAAKAEGTNLDVVRCKGFAHGMQAAYTAQKADAVVLTVHQWSDSLRMLESAVAELKLADANLVGLVFGQEVKGK